jgi:hypothetical protein
MIALFSNNVEKLIDSKSFELLVAANKHHNDSKASNDHGIISL